MTQLAYQLVNDPDEDFDVIAELLADDKEFAHVVRRNDKAAIVIYQSPGVMLEIDVDELIGLLQSARESLR